MRILAAIFTFAVMIPFAHAQEGDDAPPPPGGICIQSTEGNTVCL